MIQMHRAWVAIAAATLATAACGGPAKPAESATNDDCPAGTEKKGGDCVMPDDESGPSTSSTSSSSSSTSGTGGGGSTPATPPAAKTPYDKDAVEMVLHKAANQVKGNCGATTDEDGKAVGPWGKLTVNITLARNGRIHDVAVPPPYDDKPVGKCIGLAFRNLVYPPYAAPADVVIPWEVELVPPGK